MCCNHNQVLFSFMICHRVRNKSNMTGTSCGVGRVYLIRTHEFIPVFAGVRVARSLVFCVVYCTSLFVLLHLGIV